MKKTEKALHSLVVLTIIGQLLWAGMLFWAGQNLWALASVGMFFLYASLYWFYGIDYFKVEWLLKLKYRKEYHNNSSA